jgi:nitrogen fixation protein FixH
MIINQMTSLHVPAYLSVGLFCCILNVFLLTAYLVSRCFPKQAVEKQRQSRKRFVEALEDFSQAEALSKKLKMDRIIAKATIQEQRKDVEQGRVKMAAMHAFFMPRTP